MAVSVDLPDPTWINEPTYDAEELRRSDGVLVAAGLTTSVARSGVMSVRDLEVSIISGQVIVAGGGCIVGTTKGVYRVALPSTINLGALTPADATNPRRDRVVLEILDPDNMGGAGRKARIRVIDGTPSATAASGGGFPNAPSTAFIDLGYGDMPKSGAGSPVVTDVRQMTAAAGAPVPVRSLTEANALPKYDGAMRVRLDVPGRPLQVHDGVKWVTVSPDKRTDFDVAGLTNASGTTSRIIANLALDTKPYPRIIRLQGQAAIAPGAIVSGVSTVYLAASLMTGTSGAAQGKAPISWTNPGYYLQGATVDSGEILVPAGVAPLARFWVHVASGSITTTVSVVDAVTKFWAYERPADS